MTSESALDVAASHPAEPAEPDAVDALLELRAEANELARRAQSARATLMESTDLPLDEQLDLLLTFRAISDHVKTTSDQLKLGVDEVAMERWRTEQLRASWDRPVGSVYLQTGKPSPQVVDDAAFMEWLREHHPHAIVETIDANAAKAILGDLDGWKPVVGSLVADADGEPIPGVKVLYSSGARLVAKPKALPAVPEDDQ